MNTMQKSKAARPFPSIGSGKLPFCRTIARELGITPGHVHAVASGKRHSPRLLAYCQKRQAELKADQEAK